jgi:hypothetical protein
VPDEVIGNGRPAGGAFRPDRSRGRAKFGIIERARAHAHRQALGGDRAAIHLRAADLAEAALHRVAAVRDHREQRQIAGDRNRLFREQHVDRGRTAGDALAITAPAHARAKGLCRDSITHCAAEASAGVGLGHACFHQDRRVFSR